jgi:hypothetical protein
MTSNATTIEEYISQLPDDRVQPIESLRKIIKKNLPKGFVEEISYGMIGYVIPHKLYPGGYHCDPKLPLPFMSIASQKNFIAVYNMAIYSDQGLYDWYVQSYGKLNIGKMDIGKSCTRFKNMHKIPYELIGQLASKVSPEDWIKLYSKMDPRVK